MNDFETINVPDMTSILAQRIMAKKSNTESAFPTGNSIDPYQMMLSKKNGDIPQEILDIRQEWPSEDISTLESFCRKNGIIGFNCGKMNPKAALALLKKQVGNFENVPMDDRVIDGYQKVGTESMNPKIKKHILFG